MKKKDKKKKKIGSAKDLINEIKKNYPNREGEVEINYHRKDGNEYNDAKNDFIKREETKAITWFKNLNSIK